MSSEALDDLLAKIDPLMREIYERAGQNIPQPKVTDPVEQAAPTLKRRRLVWSHQKRAMEDAGLVGSQEQDDHGQDDAESEEGSFS